MPLHRDIHWLGRQWAVTGHGLQLINQKQMGYYDIEAARLWEARVTEVQSKAWIDRPDFDNALELARARFAQLAPADFSPSAAVAPLPPPVRTPPLAVPRAPLEPSSVPSIEELLARLKSKSAAAALVAKPAEAPTPDPPEPEPAKPEPPRIELRQVEASKSEPAKSEPPKSELPKPEPPKPELPKLVLRRTAPPEPPGPARTLEPPKALPAKPVFLKPEPPRPAPAKFEAGKSEAGRSELLKSESPSSPQPEPRQTAPVAPELPSSEAPRVEPAKAEVAKPELAEPASAEREGSKPESPLKSEPLNSETPKPDVRRPAVVLVRPRAGPAWPAFDGKIAATGRFVRPWRVTSAQWHGPSAGLPPRP